MDFLDIYALDDDALRAEIKRARAEADCLIRRANRCQAIINGRDARMMMIEANAARDAKNSLAHPDWDHADRPHDWRNHVPPHVRLLWPTFDDDQRAALHQWAVKLADAVALGLIRPVNWND